MHELSRSVPNKERGDTHSQSRQAQVGRIFEAGQRGSNQKSGPADSRDVGANKKALEEDRGPGARNKRL